MVDLPLNIMVYTIIIQIRTASLFFPLKMWSICGSSFIFLELLTQFPSALLHVLNRLRILYAQQREPVTDLFQWLQLLNIAEKWPTLLLLFFTQYFCVCTTYSLSTVLGCSPTSSSSLPPQSNKTVFRKKAFNGLCTIHREIWKVFVRENEF